MRHQAEDYHYIAPRKFLSFPVIFNDGKLREDSGVFYRVSVFALCPPFCLLIFFWSLNIPPFSETSIKVCVQLYLYPYLLSEQQTQVLLRSEFLLCLYESSHLSWPSQVNPVPGATSSWTFDVPFLPPFSSTLSPPSMAYHPISVMVVMNLTCGVLLSITGFCRFVLLLPPVAGLLLRSLATEAKHLSTLASFSLFSSRAHTLSSGCLLTMKWGVYWGF